MRTPFSRVVQAVCLSVLTACSGSGGGHETTYTNHGETQSTEQDAGTQGSGGGTFAEDAGAAVTVETDAGTTVILEQDAGGATPPEDAGTVQTPRFAIVPMHLVPAPGATGDNARIDLELRADGTLYSHNEYVGQIVGDGVLGPRGREIIAVAPDGAITLDGRRLQWHMLETGDIAQTSGATVSFGDDGGALASVPGQPPQRGPLTLLGYRPEARRTAGLMALIIAATRLALGR